MVKWKNWLQGRIVDKGYGCRRDSGSVQMTLQFIKLLHILENILCVGTFGSVSAYKSLYVFYSLLLKFVMEVQVKN